MPGMAVTAAIDAVFTTQPGSPDARMRGTNAWMPWITPQRSTSITRCHSDSGSSHELPPRDDAGVVHAHVQLPEVLDRGVGGALHRVGIGDVDDERVHLGAARRAVGSRARVRLASSRSVISTRMPAATNASVVARPMPLAAPVTTALRPSSCSIPAMRSPSVCASASLLRKR